jgi:hypothetical protein
MENGNFVGVIGEIGRKGGPTACPASECRDFEVRGILRAGGGRERAGLGIGGLEIGNWRSEIGNWKSAGGAGSDERAGMPLGALGAEEGAAAGCGRGGEEGGGEGH